MADALSWSLNPSPHGQRIRLAGIIDENADFSALLPLLQQATALDLESVTRINSTGVREWMSFVSAAEKAGHALTLHNCSVAFMSQLNMITGFAGRAHIASIRAPFVCPSCEASADLAFDVDDNLDARVRAEAPCPECRAAMELDDLPDHFLSFARR
jgi:ABC-type transporter Mla MlaB component